MDSASNISGWLSWFFSVENLKSIFTYNNDAPLIFTQFFFWAFFEQSGGSLSLVAREHVTHNIAGVTLDPNEVNNR